MEALKDIVKLKNYDSYKNSRVEWFGEIPKHWELSRLGKILQPISVNNRIDLPLLSITRDKGVILRGANDEDENHNFIPDDLTNYKQLLKGQFGMNKMKAWQGSYGISKFNGIVSPAYFIFNVVPKLSPAFFHIAIRSRLYVSFFGSASDGVRIGQWDLSKERMKQIPFLIPPIEEQTIITNFLVDKTAKIDQAIALKQKQIELLKERRQILIQRAVTKGLDPNVKMKDSGVEWIGEMPVGWQVINFRYLIGILTDFTANGSFGDLARFVQYLDTPSYSRLIRLTDLRQNLNNQQGVYVNEKSHSYLKKSELFGGELLMSNVGAYAGLAWLMPKVDSPATLGPNMFLIKLKDSLIQTEYLCELLNSDSFWKVLKTIALSSAQPKLNKENIRSLKIVLPPIDEQKQIIDYLKDVGIKFKTAISLKEQEIEKLMEYKISLVDSAVTGKVKVC